MDCREKSKLHIVMFPWLAFGHMIPYLELAKLMAQKGHRISFLSTPRNIHRLPKPPPNLWPLINFVAFPLPRVDGLPENAEATIDISYNKHPNLKEAFDGLQEPVARFLETSDPDWVLYDLAYWLCPIAVKFRISCAFFPIFNAGTMSFLGSSSSVVMDGDEAPFPLTKPEHFTVPPPWVPFSTNIAFRLYEARKIFDTTKQNVSGVSDWFRFCSSVRGCDVFAARSCTELESDWLNLLKEFHQRPLLPVGLLPPMAQDSRDDKHDIFVQISEWLDKQYKGSVIYIAFGSEVSLTQDELTELALGLELSELPFFWVLRKQSSLEECDSIELPDGFEDRVKGRGLVWRSWAPQLRILGHESVGGFLTHCGWSSIIEGLQHGHALIMLPLWGDQGLVARVFEEKKVGIEIPRDEEDGSFTRNSVAESVRLVMVDENKKTYMDKAKEMMKIFGDKQLHNQYVDAFVEYLEKHKPTPKG